MRPPFLPGLCRSGWNESAVLILLSPWIPAFHKSVKKEGCPGGAGGPSRAGQPPAPPPRPAPRQCCQSRSCSCSTRLLSWPPCVAVHASGRNGKNRPRSLGLQDSALLLAQCCFPEYKIWRFEEAGRTCQLNLSTPAPGAPCFLSQDLACRCVFISLCCSPSGVSASCHPCRLL